MSLQTGFRSFNGVKNKWLILRIIQYGLLVNIVNVNYVSANKVCRKFKSDSEENWSYHQVQPSEFDKCPPSSAPFSVYTAHNNGNNSNHKALLVCLVKGVRSFALQLERPVQIDDVAGIQGLRVHTCSNSNDTLIYNRKYTNKHVYRLILNFTLTDGNDFSFRAYYSQKSRDIRQKQHRLVQYRYGSVSEASKRRKRDVVLDFEHKSATKCGKSMSCYREGPEGCDHFSCTYFVSYNVNNDVVDVEMSAKTDGWIGIGFSSDRKMGGDEVIACKKVSSEVEVDTYTNPSSHNYPRKKSDTNVLTLISYQIHDGFLFCHFTRNPTIQGFLDLTNDWHQLYAYGSLSQGGGLEKHSVLPKVSRKLSIVMLFDEYGNKADNLVRPNSPVIFLAVLYSLCVFVKSR
ncbi:DOMON domain-containing protein frrs1l [Mactra antiquata]